MMPRIITPTDFFWLFLDEFAETNQITNEVLQGIPENYPYFEPYRRDFEPNLTVWDQT